MMGNDLISRSALIEKMSDTGVQISFDLPVEEILGEDVDMDDFVMLVQDVIQAYRKMVIDAIQNQPTAYNLDAVIRRLEENSNNPDRGRLNKIYLDDAIDIVRNGGKE